MRYKNLMTIIMVMTISLYSSFSMAQSLTTKTDAELETLKKEAIASENFELAKQIKTEQDSRKSLDDLLAEKQNELKTALANEDYSKAEVLKKEISVLEAKIANLKVLEEDKKIAIFQERYDDVMALEGQISRLKSPEAAPQPVLPTAAPTPAPAATPEATAESLINSMGMTKSTVKMTSLKKVGLDEVDYKDKVICQFGFGIGTYTYEYAYYDYFYNTTITESYDESVFALSFNVSRWWVNKYIAGGYYFDFSPSDFGGIAYGAQMTGFAEFESILLPYASLGIGPGFNGWDEEFYFPIIFKLGSNVFFNTNRSIGAFAELNLFLNNEYMPKYRIGLAWSYVKRRARK